MSDNKSYQLIIAGLFEGKVAKREEIELMIATGQRFLSDG